MDIPKDFFLYPIDKKKSNLKHSTSKFKKFLIYQLVGLILLEVIPILSPIIFLTFALIVGLPNLLIISIVIPLAFLSMYFLYIVFAKFSFQIDIVNYRIDLENLKKPFKFIFISDLHIEKNRVGTKQYKLNKIINLINEQNVDHIFFGGDFVGENIDKELLYLLKNIRAKNKYAVYGNHDAFYLFPGGEGKNPKEIIDLLESCGIKFLINTGVSVREDIFVGGIPDLWSGHFDLDKTFENSKTEQTKILLSHNPDIIDYISPKIEPDLILSGHNHGGQINFLFFKLPIPSKYKNLRLGFFQITKKTKLFLTSGAGHSGTRLRIGTKSEICLFEII